MPTATAMLTAAALLSLAAAACGQAGDAEAEHRSVNDPRDIAGGSVIAVEGMRYFDQPYVVHNTRGEWVCLVTVGTLGEGAKGSENYTVATISGDHGRTWSKPIRCQQTYAVPLATPFGRVHAVVPRSFAFSDDGGRTWSPLRPIPKDVSHPAGRSGAAWACDPQLLKRGQRHHVVFIVDGGPKIITVVVDGRCCDGGASRQFGWGRFPPDLADVTGGPELKIAAAARIHSLRVYSRLLLTGEAVGNFRAGCGP